MTSDEKLRLAAVPAKLLAWYAQNARELPWRIGPKERSSGITPDPYRVWLAEIMLQQTTVPHAARYYQLFTTRWPSVSALAGAQDADVMAAWAGLGYYARARNLLKCARHIKARGGWPQTAAELEKLPGIGPYTAGAVAALAFGEASPAVDGNVERVFSRLLAAKGPWPQEKKKIRALVASLVPADAPAEFAEGLMDLGATVCLPKQPNCALCPLSDVCAGQAEGSPEDYPIKPKKAASPHRRGHVFIVSDGKGQVLTERRPDKGLLGGMLGLPTTEWLAESGEAVPFPFEGNWRNAGEVRHVFTHFSLALTVWQADGSGQGVWTPKQDALAALPTVFSKALKLVVDTAR